MIHNDDELDDAVARAGELLQDIQDYLERDLRSAGKVRFPRGFIRGASYYRRRIQSFVPDETVRKNLSYNFMLSNIYLWLLSRTDITSIAADMVIKAGIVLAGSLCESMMQQALKGVVGRDRSYKDRTQYLAKHHYISSDLRDELNWLWDRRCNIHLSGVKSSEYDHYKRSFYNRAATSVRELVTALDARAKALAAA